MVNTWACPIEEKERQIHIPFIEMCWFFVFVFLVKGDDLTNKESNKIVSKKKINISNSCLVEY